MGDAEVILAGFGGQGILAAGEILALAGMLAGKHVAWMPEYGPATRGGTANCTVILSEDEIGTTVVDRPSAVIIMNKPSLAKFLPQLREGGLAVVNADLVPLPETENIRPVSVACNTIAKECGDVRAANLVALGAYIAHSGIVSRGHILKSLREWSKKHDKKDMLAVNKKALLALLDKEC